MGGEVELEHPIDSDVDLRVGAQRRELARRHAPVLVAIAFGGGLGALARFGLTLLLPVLPGQFPWATFFANVLGCLLIGVLMVLITERWTVHRLVRPFLGVGVLGGFTTFSTYAVEIRGLLQPGTVGLAFAYLAGTFLCAMLAVITGVSVTRAALRLNTARQEVA
ncbi:fluoride efflux transporter FluC [Amycolatopsis taiwanensis]|uniref:Fluoride-specific ion channel FluC n=1 Tax=Amycolatopsis taiwanensis TaxID=342230 RepID=A0A9W6R434_9PSEU|nr:CrcB family protein [Amycolatopsis taiwanensis]GLY67212.1 putative fluoride ion transporter CrcB 1 [Amycolatopsis taiwanensis]